MRYKAGDKVKVREDLIANTYYGGVRFANSMKNLLGTILTISETKTCTYPHFYTVKEYDWAFSDEMFEDIVDIVEKGDNMKNFKIISYNKYNDKVVTVTFEDGTQEKAVCNEADNFDLENGVCVCLMKHILGADKYKSMIKTAMKQINAIDKAEEAEKQRIELIERKRAKAARKKARRKERERAERIADMKEAYVAALKECGMNHECECGCNCEANWDDLK